MGIYQLYEKLGPSPEPALSSNNSTNSSNTSATTGSSGMGPLPEAAGVISNETANELQRHVTGIVDSQKTLIECVVAVTNARVSAQRLCYRLDSEAYSFYNNAESREQLKQARLSVMERIRDVQQRILAFDRYICTSVPPAAASGYRKRPRQRQRVSAYESKRSKYLRSLRALVSEFSGILDQQKRDLKEVCNDYCHFITERYQTVNQYISPQDIKVFISYLDKPLLLPKSNENSDQLAPELAGNPYIKTIVTEILYRRQDLHLILDTLRLIDSVSPSLKVIEHRFILNSFSQGYRDEYLGHDYDDEDALLSDSDSESGLSDASEDLVVMGQPKSIVQRVLGIFGARGKRHDYLLDGSDDDDDDDDEADDFDRSKERTTDGSGREGVDEEADQRYRGSTDAHQFLLLTPATVGSRPSFINRLVNATSLSTGRRHVILAVLLLLGTLMLVLIMLAEVLHF